MLVNSTSLKQKNLDSHFNIPINPPESSIAHQHKQVESIASILSQLLVYHASHSEPDVWPWFYIFTVPMTCVKPNSGLYTKTFPWSVINEHFYLQWESLRFERFSEANGAEPVRLCWPRETLSFYTCLPSFLHHVFYDVRMLFFTQHIIFPAKPIQSKTVRRLYHFPQVKKK